MLSTEIDSRFEACTLSKLCKNQNREDYKIRVAEKAKTKV